jgi:transposase
MSRRYFSREFKLRVLRAVRDETIAMADVARQHGLRPDLVRRWRRELGAEVGFLAHVPPTARGAEAELESLRREVAHLREERDILKKAAAFFAEQPS